MRVVCVCAILATLIVSGCVGGRAESFSRAGYDFSKVDKVAIVTIEGAVRSEPVKNQISEFFAMELLKKGYAPLGRSHVKALLKGQESSIDLTTPEGAAQAGKVLKVPVVLIVNVPYFSEQVSMMAVMINVEDGSYLWMGSGSGKTVGFLSSIFGTGTEPIAMPSGENEQAFGGLVAGQLASAPQALTPGEAKRVQKIVKKICASLPPRIRQPEVKKGIWPALF